MNHNDARIVKWLTNLFHWLLYPNFIVNSHNGYQGSIWSHGCLQFLQTRRRTLTTKVTFVSLLTNLQIHKPIFQDRKVRDIKSFVLQVSA